MIVIPYLMTASCGFLVAATFFFLFLCKPYVQLQRSSIKPSDSAKHGIGTHYGSCNSVIKLLPEQNAKPETFHKIVIVLGGLTFCFYSGIETMDLTMLPEYLMSLDISISKSTATLMLSVTSASFAASRVMFILLSERFNNRILMCMSIALMAISHCMLLYAGSKSMILISAILMGSGLAPFQAAIFAFIEERVHFTSSLSGRVMFLSAVANVADMLLISKLVQSHPQTFVWINMGSLSLCSLLLAGLHVNDVVREKKCQRKGSIAI